MKEKNFFWTEKGGWVEHMFEFYINSNIGDQCEKLDSSAEV